MIYFTFDVGIYTVGVSFSHTEHTFYFALVACSVFFIVYHTNPCNEDKEDHINVIRKKGKTKLSYKPRLKEMN